MLEDSLQEDVYTQFRALIQKHFPEFFFRHKGYTGFNFYADLASENKLFKDTPYFYKEELTFIHWTSINNLLSILNNREIRLYNLYNSEDEHEFYYAAEILGLESAQINYLKKYYYTFSFCKKEDINNKYLWGNYGDNYKGVAIKFTIENDPTEWDKFMISNIHYSVPDNFKEFAAFILKISMR